MQFIVRSVSVEPNVRGQSMRRVVLQAIEGDEFLSDDPLPKGVTPPDPDGTILLLLGAKAAKRFAVGDVFVPSLREKE